MLVKFIKSNIVTIIVMLIIGSLIGLYVGTCYQFPWADSPDDLGQLGSFLSTLVALIAVYLAIDANKGQNTQFKQQAFSDGFYKLLEFSFNNLEIVTSSQSSYGSSGGRKAIQNCIDDLIRYIQEDKIDTLSQSTSNTDFRTIKAQGFRQNFYRIPHISFFIDIISNLTSYISKSSVDLATQKEYLLILLSQLTNNEKELIVIVANNDNGFKNKILAIDANIFSTLPDYEELIKRKLGGIIS